MLGTYQEVEMPADAMAEPIAPPTRRERQRQATHDEIVEVSRRLLREEESLSLRGVATEMGITAPALYRYVDSFQELLMLVAMSVFGDVLAAMGEARDRHPDEDPAAQILATTVAFRRWALANPREFALIFANPATSSDGEPPPPDSGPGMFGGFFKDMFVRLWQRYDFPLPSDDELDPAVAAMLKDPDRARTLPSDFPGHPFGLTWVFTQCWGRLYGTVTLEVFRHMEATIISSGALFRSMLDDNARDLGFGDDWPRLRALIEAEMTRPA